MKIALTIALLLSGCAKSNPGVTSQPPATERVVVERPAHPEAQIYAELWRICKAKHLKYEVSCLKDLGCDARAWDEKESSPSDHIDYWREFILENDPTAAAALLVKALSGAPNELANPREHYKPRETTFDTGTIRP